MGCGVCSPVSSTLGVSPPTEGPDGGLVDGLDCELPTSPELNWLFVVWGRKVEGEMFFVNFVANVTAVPL